MRIIKKGTIRSQNKIFDCPFCGCIFEAGLTEYKASEHCIGTVEGDPKFEAECPCCGRTVYHEI